MDGMIWITPMVIGLVMDIIGVCLLAIPLLKSREFPKRMHDEMFKLLGIESSSDKKTDLWAFKMGKIKEAMGDEPIKNTEQQKMISQITIMFSILASYLERESRTQKSYVLKVAFGIIFLTMGFVLMIIANLIQANLIT